MFTVPPTTYSNDGWLTASNQSFPSAVANTGAAVTASGSTQIVMASTAGLGAGQSVGLNLAGSGAVAAGSQVTAVNGGTNTITISTPTNASISAGTKLFFGTATPSSAPLEVQRIAYNVYLRSSFGALGCNGVVDIDAVVADTVNLGKWRTDLGQATVDGVHPAAILHQAAVTAGVITPAMFSVP